MSNVIIVGVDGRPHSRDAVTLGAALADVTDARVVLVHVHPYDPLAFGVAGTGPLSDDARKLLAEAAEAAPCPVETMPIAAGSPSEGLHLAAEEREARMIVVGSSHRAGVGRMLLGSHAEAVVAGAPCAVAVAPAGLADRSWSLRRVTVGFDGGQEAREALVAAREIARSAGATLELVGVLPDEASYAWTPYTYMPDWERVRDAQRARLEHQLRSAAEGAPIEIRVGNPAEQLDGVTVGTDLLVLGSRGYGPIRRVLLGGTAHRVVRNAACPVLVVPRSAGVATSHTDDPPEEVAAA